jgi:hypothetical protein
MTAIRRRLVVFLPGFEAMPVEAHARRFMREARRSASVYGLEISAASTTSPGGDTATLEIAAQGKDGETRTEIHVSGMEGAGTLYAARNPFARLATGLLALLDFTVSGTLLRFARTSWRYVLFFLFPIAFLALVLLACWFAWRLVFLVSDNAILALTAAAAAAALLLWIGQRRLHLLLVMDDWTFARDLARGRTPSVDAALDRLATSTVRRASEGEFEEIVIAAHSLGAIPAVGLTARLVGGQATHVRIGLLTAGSSLMKVALHPSAGGLRDDVATIARAKTPWLDAQSLTDPINFYGSHPLKSLDIADSGSVSVMRVRFRTQLEPSRYRRMKYNLFAVHRQFVGGVDKPAPYSFHAILCGPEPFAVVAARPGLPVKKMHAESAANRGAAA